MLKVVWKLEDYVRNFKQLPIGFQGYDTYVAVAGFGMYKLGP